MKKVITILEVILLCSLILIAGCDKENDEAEKKAGKIQFKTLNPFASGQKSAVLLKSKTSNPKLTGDTTSTILTSLKLTIGDVWVSQGEIKAGVSDNLEWIKLTSITNTEAKLFEDYSFSAIEIPEGNYISIKITFRNIFYRCVQLVSDPSVKYELLETMGSWTAPCDATDTTWATTNYFGPDGNHKINDNGLFELESSGEKIGGFSIEAGKTAIVSWRLLAGYTGTCYTYIIDENDNLEWDCGNDRVELECLPESEYMYMWDFLVEYE